MGAISKPVLFLSEPVTTPPPSCPQLGVPFRKEVAGSDGTGLALQTGWGERERPAVSYN